MKSFFDTPFGEWLRAFATGAVWLAAVMVAASADGLILGAITTIIGFAGVLFMAPLLLVMAVGQAVEYVGQRLRGALRTARTD